MMCAIFCKYLLQLPKFLSIRENWKSSLSKLPGIGNFIEANAPFIVFLRYLDIKVLHNYIFIVIVDTKSF